MRKLALQCEQQFKVRRFLPNIHKFTWYDRPTIRQQMLNVRLMHRT